jgi:hypothetical protein
MRTIVLVPSRGRPANAERCLASIRETARDHRTAALVLVDADDPTLEDYRALDLPVWVVPPGGRFTGALNHAAAALAEGYDAMGAFGDDVIFRTSGWDVKLSRVLHRPGIAYGDDRMHGERHPTAVFMSTEVYRALGWLALPVVFHTWADDGWKRLGIEAGILRYMPSVILEHMHPFNGKAEDDATYRLVYSQATGDHDYAAFNAWVADGLEADVARVQAALR